MHLSRSRESGFTLMEMLVAMVLLMIASTMLSVLLMNGFQSDQATSKARQAQEEGNRTLDLVGDDIRGAFAPAREDFTIMSTRDDLKQIISTNPGLVAEIQTATQTQLTLVSDVLSTSAGPECVTWQVVTAGTTRSLQRVVTNANAAGACVGGVLSTEVIARIDATLTNGAPPVFTYETMQGAIGSCTLQTRTTAGTAAERARIMAVSIDLQGYISGGKATGEQSVKDTATLKSRDTNEYLYALGCTY